MGEKSINRLSKITISIALIIGIALTLCVKQKDAVTSKAIETNVFDVDSVMDVNIDMSEEDWNDLIEDAMDEEFKSATVTINGETFHNVGVRAKGNSSLLQVASDDSTDRFSLKLDFDQFVSDQTYHDMETIVLNNCISDATYMKEYITFDLFDYMGLATPEYEYANIKVNDKDWGFYLAIEVVDKCVVEKNFGTTEGNLYKPETMGIGGSKGGPGEMIGPEGENNLEVKDGQSPSKENSKDVNNNAPNTNGENPGAGQEAPNKNQGGPEMGGGPGGMGIPGGNRAKEGADFKYVDDNISSYSILRDSAVFKTTTDTDFQKIITMLKSLNEGSENLEECLNVDEILRYFAVNTFVLNFDSYSGGMYHNYYLYENNGYCTIIPWDLNMSFGGFGVKDASSAINFPVDSAVTGNLEDAPLIGKLLEVDEYKEKYHEYLKQIMDEYFNSGRFQNLVEKTDKLIENYVKADATALYSYDEYKAGVKELLTFGKDRSTAVKAQLDGEQPADEYGNIETSLNLKALGGQGGGLGMGGPEGNQKEENKSDNKEEKTNGTETEPPANATQEGTAQNKEGEALPPGGGKPGDVSGEKGGVGVPPNGGKPGDASGNKGGAGAPPNGGKPGDESGNNGKVGASPSDMPDNQAEIVEVNNEGNENSKETNEKAQPSDNEETKEGNADKSTGMDAMREKMQERMVASKKVQNANIVTSVASVVVLLAALIFSIKFKRKKYKY